MPKTSELTASSPATVAALRTALGIGGGTGGPPPAGTGFRRVIVGVESAAASFPSKAEVGLSNVNDTSDLAKPISTLQAAVNEAQAATNALKADLVSGKVPTSQIPAISIGATYTATSQAAMLALAAVVGDIAIRTDLTPDEKFLLLGNPTVLSDWSPLGAAGAVTSVNGQTGGVTLGKGDIGLTNADNTSDANKPVSTPQQAELDIKAPLASPVLTGTPRAPTAAAATNTTQIATTAFVIANADTEFRADLAANAASGKGTTLVDHYDPVAPAYLKTVSDIVNGERVSVLRGINKALHAGIRASTNTDDHSTAINALLQAMKTAKYGDLYFPDGTYTSLKIVVPGNMRITGRSATIKAHSTLAISSALLTNEVLSGAINVWADKDITIDGITFQGLPTVDRGLELVGFGKVHRLRLYNVRVTSSRYIGLALGGCKDVQIVGFEGDDTGKLAVTAEGGAALWLDNATDGTNTQDVRIVRPYIHDTEWSAMYLNARRIAVIAPHILNVKESAIFSNITNGQNISILGGHIEAVRKKNISAAGIEAGTQGLSIRGMTIIDTDHASIALTDVQNATIHGNHLLDFGKELAANGSGVAIITTNAAPSQPKNILVSHNRIIDRQGSVTGYCAIEMGNSGAAVEGVRLLDNDCTGWTQRASKMIMLAAGKLGVNCERRGNLGTPDETSVNSQFRPSAGTGAKSVTGIGFRPRRIDFHVVAISAVLSSTSYASVNKLGTTPTGSFSATDGTGAHSGVHNSAWLTKDGAGATTSQASFASYDDDGFTVNVTTAATLPWVNYICYP